ncbi:Rpn family recombination-promoting nuclease/putative transposase [Amphibacillus indicireducens]
MQNPHDKFFKATFSNIEVAKDFLTYFVPQPIIELIDLTSLKLEKDSFVSHKLDENFTDLPNEKAHRL